MALRRLKSCGNCSYCYCTVSSVPTTKYKCRDWLIDWLIYLFATLVVVDLSGTVASCHQFADVITAQVPMCYRGSCVLMFACVYKTSFMNFWQTELRFAPASLSLSVSVSRSRPWATQTMTDPLEMLFRKWSHGAQPPKQLCIRSGPGSQNNDTFGKTYLHMPRLARGRYSQPYSLGGSSDAASGYQSTVAICFLYSYWLKELFNI